MKRFAMGVRQQRRTGYSFPKERIDIMYGKKNT
jgi:hypothetical protein